MSGLVGQMMERILYDHIVALVALRHSLSRSAEMGEVGLDTANLA
jgi:hypothetical protein